jgi:hypothetical protein
MLTGKRGPFRRVQTMEQNNNARGKYLQQRTK